MPPISFSKGWSFRHSGDLGDIILSLPTIRAMGGGTLYLDPHGGHGRPLLNVGHRTRTKLTASTIDSLKPLLLQQPYLVDVRHWNAEPVDHDLDLFRRHYRFQNISDSHLHAFNLPFSHRDTAWLHVADPITIPNRPIVISCSVRWQGNYEFWDELLPTIKNQCIFVGLAKEHEIFEYTYSQKIDWYETPDILTLARVIAGSQHFYSNQGLPHALAEAMKKNLTCEINRANPAVIFNRPRATYV